MEHEHEVTVRRILRSETVIKVRAKNAQEARALAKLQARQAAHDWKAYDVEYHSFLPDVRIADAA